MLLTKIKKNKMPFVILTLGSVFSYLGTDYTDLFWSDQIKKISDYDYF